MMGCLSDVPDHHITALGSPPGPVREAEDPLRRWVAARGREVVALRSCRLPGAGAEACPPRRSGAGVRQRGRSVTVVRLSDAARLRRMT